MAVRARSRASSSEQERAAVRLQRAQFVQFGAVAVGDHAAFANHRRGLRQDRAGQQLEAIGRLFEIALELIEQSFALWRGGHQFGKRDRGCRATPRGRAAGRSSVRCGRRCARCPRSGAACRATRRGRRLPAGAPPPHGARREPRGRATGGAASGAAAGCPCCPRRRRAATTASAQARRAASPISSRLRRVAGSRRTYSPPRSARTEVTCASDCPWVFRA